MSKQQQKIQAPAVGGSSLLVIFAILCLTVFALLGLSTVQADKRLSDASAQAVEAYYAAEDHAQEILAQLRAGEMPAEVIQHGARYRYLCEISDTQALAVEVELQGGNYRILRWQAEVTVDWNGDQSLDVWGGSQE